MRLMAARPSIAKERLRIGDKRADTYDQVFTDEAQHPIHAGRDHDAWRRHRKGPTRLTSGCTMPDTRPSICCSRLVCR